MHKRLLGFQRNPQNTMPYNVVLLAARTKILWVLLQNSKKQSQIFWHQQNSFWLEESVCLAFTVFENHRKVLFCNIASEASYVYILNGQKLSFCRVFENMKLAVKQRCQTGQLKSTKIGGKCQNQNIQMTHFG